jgi:hypothetical protein
VWLAGVKEHPRQQWRDRREKELWHGERGRRGERGLAYGPTDTCHPCKKKNILELVGWLDVNSFDSKCSKIYGFAVSGTKSNSYCSSMAKKTSLSSIIRAIFKKIAYCCICMVIWSYAICPHRRWLFKVYCVLIRFSTWKNRHLVIWVSYIAETTDPFSLLDYKIFLYILALHTFRNHYGILI